METIYFVDFDHTISNRDVWDDIVKFCDPAAREDVVGRYLRGELSSRQCNLLLASIIKPREEEIRQRVFSIGIDPTFHDFVRWTERRGSKMIIVSDGYDYYIDLLLEKEGLTHLTYFSNRMKWTDDGIDVEFPLNVKDCERDMAHCKCQHIAPHADKRRVYIGDGVSDVCGALKCEQIYAKRNLLDYCREHGIAHISFKNFLDVIAGEEAWLALQESPAALID